MDEKLNIYQKIHEARKFIKTFSETKSGWNEYSKYKYFTPEQVSDLVFKACEEYKLMNAFSLKRNDLGVYGELKVINMEATTEVLTFEMASAIPNITATNATQQLGGAVTYTERYLLMTAFDIKDNNLDPDAHDNSQKAAKGQNQPKQDKAPATNGQAQNGAKTGAGEPLPWLNKWTDKAHTQIGQVYQNVVSKARKTGKGVADLKAFYRISSEIEKELEKDLV